MPTIEERKHTLSVFPTSRDAFPSYQDGDRRENVTNAEIVNRIEAVILKTQEHARKTVRLAENASAGANRRRLVLAATVHNDRTRSNWTHRFTLTAEQLRF